MRRNWKRSRVPNTSCKRKKRLSSPRRASRRSTTSSSSSQSHEIHETLSRKRSEYIEKTTKELQAIAEQRVRLSEELAALGEQRMYILPKRILQQQLSEADKRAQFIHSGTALVEFDQKMNAFKKVHRRIENRSARAQNSEPPAKRQRKKPSVPRPSGNRRKSAAHNRDIRVSSSNCTRDPTFSVLLDEIEGEFGDEGDVEDPGAGAPVLYICNRNYCPDCQTVLMQKLPSESVLACPECGVSTSYIDSTAASTGHSDDRSFNQFAYCRTNHFLQWLRACQGKESVTVPEHIIEGVCAELHKRRMRVEEITSKKIRECLKTMRQRKYYEHVVLITSLLSGRTPPRFTPQIERTLRRLFQKIQKPFEIAVAAICPERKNFLSYSFILTKLCGLLRDSIDARWLTAWPSLKGKDKIYRSDRIWAHVCRQLGWRFNPSI